MSQWLHELTASKFGCLNEKLRDVTPDWAKKMRSGYCNGGEHYYVTVLVYTVTVGYRDQIMYVYISPAPYTQKQIRNHRYITTCS